LQNTINPSMDTKKNATIQSLCFLLFLTVFQTANAQGNLMKSVNIGEGRPERIGTILEKIASKGDFSFAYNNNTVPADSLISVSGYRGTVFSFLENILGDTYEYQEVPGYVVLRYAPNNLYVTADTEHIQGNQILIKGYVHDLSNNKEIPKASVYEKNLLVSTLTDERGYFELRIKNWNGPLSITVRKENFRDASVHLLADVVITGKHKKPDYKYYPDQDSSGVEHSRFVRFFIGYKQRIQALNLGNFFAAGPYQISFTPGLSSHGLYNSQIIDHFSLNLLGGYTAGVDGVELGGIFNINRKNAQYFQAAGVFNFVGGNAKGIQLAGMVNKTRNFTDGIQLAGLANIYENAQGISVAGITNIGNNSSNVQISGIVNAAKKVKGFQMALINIADSSDYPVGILNFIKNGEKSITIGTDETLFTQLNFRSGGRRLYSILGIGYKFGSERTVYQLNMGIGAHLIDHRIFFFNTEVSQSITTDFKGNDYQIYSFKTLPGIRFSKHIKLFAGPSLNDSSADPALLKLPATGWLLRKYGNDSSAHRLSLGLSGGLQYVW
jgi:hypothetical protein